MWISPEKPFWASIIIWYVTVSPLPAVICVGETVTVNPGGPLGVGDAVAPGETGRVGPGVLWDDGVIGVWSTVPEIGCACPPEEVVRRPGRKAAAVIPAITRMRAIIAHFFRSEGTGGGLSSTTGAGSMGTEVLIPRG
jgi:hypothetical protein